MLIYKLKSSKTLRDLRLFWQEKCLCKIFTLETLALALETLALTLETLETLALAHENFKFFLVQTHPKGIYSR